MTQDQFEVTDLSILQWSCNMQLAKRRLEDIVLKIISKKAYQKIKRLLSLYLTLSSQMVLNGHIYKMFYQNLFQTNVIYHSNTIIIKDIHFVICSTFIRDQLSFIYQNSFMKLQHCVEPIESEVSLFETFSATR